MPVYTILSYVYLDKIQKCYRKILICKNKPTTEEPLNNLIKSIAREKKSPYENFYCCEPVPHCVHTILNPNNNLDFLSVDNIDILFNFCLENGYKIETKLTRLLMKTKTYKNKDIVCMISRN